MNIDWGTNESYLWVTDIPKAAKFSDQQIAFLTENKIVLSGGYVGMIRAYFGNRTIWQTSCCRVLAQAVFGEGGKLPVDNINKDNREALQNWVNEMMGLDKEELGKRLGTHVPLFST